MDGTCDFAFLHGGGQGGWVWEETLAALRQQAGGRVNAIAFDLPGCGARRGEDVSELTVDDVADRFTADLAASGLKDIILVGHSNAGTILPRVALRRPDLIRRYVYLTCIVPPPGESVLDIVAARRPANADPDRPSGGRLRELFCNDMAPEYADAFMAKLHQDDWPTREALTETRWQYDHLAGLQTTFIVTLQDRAETAEQQEVYAERLHARRKIYLDAGHQAMNTRPQALAEILLGEAALRP